MKALSVQQPWGTLICGGLKDVENRKWALKNTPVRVLIHTGARRQNLDEDTMPLIWYTRIENHQIMGNLPLDMREWPASAVVGVATIERCDTDNDSIWGMTGPGAAFKWVMKDARLFKEPILDVKGKLGIFDIPGISGDDLPECAETRDISRDGTHLDIPLCRQFFNQLYSGDADTIEFNIVEENMRLFTDDLDGVLRTETATFHCGDRSFTADVLEVGIVPQLNSRGDVATFLDCKDREYEWWRAVIRIE